MFNTPLPIDNVMGEIISLLEVDSQLVLEAPPGAGKTTKVPLALIEQPWRNNKKIFVIEPRRLAAKNAAIRMASLLSEPVGKTVGYRIRLESRVSQNTVVEVMTEGVLLNKLQSDPALEEAAIVILDEFHERSIDSDLSLALLKQGRELFGDLRDVPLKLLVMSATLDGRQIADYLDAKSIRSEGKMYPVEIFYRGAFPALDNRRELVSKIVSAIHSALVQSPGNILVFLPGQGEIRRVQEALYSSTKNNESELSVFPLYGSLPFKEQEKAILDNQKNRKIVLATDIAETSLTIEGVSIVVDSGLCRKPVFDARTATTRLQTCRISKASAKQRAGRAGRLSAGSCIRLWSESEQEGLQNFSVPEILSSDLSQLLLTVLSWGANAPLELEWLDTPSYGSVGQAVDFLQILGFVKKSQHNVLSLTEDGINAASLPLEPRLSRMLITAVKLNEMDLGCDLAALLNDRDQYPQLNTVSIAERVQTFRQDNRKPSHLVKSRQQYQNVAESLNISTDKTYCLENDSEKIATILISAYPDRIALRSEGQRNQYKLSNGRRADLPNRCNLQSSDWLVVTEVSGTANSPSDRIYLAERIELSLIRNNYLDKIEKSVELFWNEKEGRFSAEEQHKIGQLVFDKKIVSQLDTQQIIAAVYGRIRSAGLNAMNIPNEVLSWLGKVQQVLPLGIGGDSWPDFEETVLIETLDDWLLPYLQDMTNLNQLKKLDWLAIFKSRLTWEQLRDLDRWFPERVQVPSGNYHRIDYSQKPPILAVKLQELFGLTETPFIADGKIALMVHMLSPAGRPLQITQDLKHFWLNTYQDVKKEMKGRYPKHPWPDDPMSFQATAKTKRALNR